MSAADDSKISEDRREALRYALAIGSGAALASSLVSPAAAQTAADNTLDRVRAAKVLRIAVLPGELPYFNKDLASGTWSGFSIEMANDIAKLLDVKLEIPNPPTATRCSTCSPTRSTSASRSIRRRSGRWWSISAAPCSRTRSAPC